MIPFWYSGSGSVQEREIRNKPISVAFKLSGGPDGRTGIISSHLFE